MTQYSVYEKLSGRKRKKEKKTFSVMQATKKLGFPGRLRKEKCQIWSQQNRKKG
jgi:hypothetical protein